MTHDVLKAARGVLNGLAQSNVLKLTHPGCAGFGTLLCVGLFGTLCVGFDTLCVISC